MRGLSIKAIISSTDLESFAGGDAMLRDLAMDSMVKELLADAGPREVTFRTEAKLGGVSVEASRLSLTADEQRALKKFVRLMDEANAGPGGPDTYRAKVARIAIDLHEQLMIEEALDWEEEEKMRGRLNAQAKAWLSDIEGP